MTDIIDVRTKMANGEKVTQRERVLDDLYRWGDEGVCGTMWLAAYIPRYSVHIHVLRKEGYEIDNVRCTAGHHNHNSKQVRFVLRQPVAVVGLVHRGRV